MDNKEIVSSLFKALDDKDYEKAASIIDTNFQLTGPFPKPFNKEEFLGSIRGLHVAFPDFSYNLSNVEDKGNKVRLSIQITGSHQGELSIPNGPTIPATNKSISLPRGYGTATLREGKVAGIIMEVGPDGGLPGILKQLGVKPPT